MNLVYLEGFSIIFDDELGNFFLFVDGNDSLVLFISIDVNDDKVFVFILMNLIIEDNFFIVFNYGGGSFFVIFGFLVVFIIDFNVINLVVNFWSGNVGFEEGVVGVFFLNWGIWNLI